MTDEEKANRDHNFIAARCSNLITEAALFAVNFGVPEELFVIGCSNAYRDMVKLLNYKPEPKNE